MKAMDRFPGTTRDGARNCFDAAEALFKLTFPKVSRLGSSEITQQLTPVLASMYEAAALNAAKKMAASFGDWVDGSHQYRHAQGTEVLDPPPVDLAIAMISAGLGHVRWLAEIDQRRQAQT